MEGSETVLADVRTNFWIWMLGKWEGTDGVLFADIELEVDKAGASGCYTELDGKGGQTRLIL